MTVAMVCRHAFLSSGITACVLNTHELCLSLAGFSLRASGCLGYSLQKSLILGKVLKDSNKTDRAPFYPLPWLENIFFFFYYIQNSGYWKNQIMIRLQNYMFKHSQCVFR